MAGSCQQTPGTVPPGRLHQGGGWASLWFFVSHFLVALIALVVMIRTVHAVIVGFALRRSGEPGMWSVWGLQISSVAAGWLALSASLIAHVAFEVVQSDLWLWLFFTCEFASFFAYDAWLLCRQKALQCHFFRTPPILLAAICVVILFALVEVAFLLEEWSQESFESKSTNVVSLYITQYFLQLIVLTGMTYLFTRPLAMLGLGGCHFGARDDDEEATAAEAEVSPGKMRAGGGGGGGSSGRGGRAPGAVLRDVVFRTAFGAALHLISSVCYMTGLAMWQHHVLCSLGRGTVFHLSMLGLVVHVGLSHRDDLPVRKVARHLFTSLLLRLPSPACCRGLAAAAPAEEGAGQGERAVAGGGAGGAGGGGPRNPNGAVTAEQSAERPEGTDLEEAAQQREFESEARARSVSLSSSLSSVVTELHLFVIHLEAEERFLLQRSQQRAWPSSSSSYSSDDSRLGLNSTGGSLPRPRFNSSGLGASSHDFRRSVSFDEGLVVHAKLSASSPSSSSSPTHRNTASPLLQDGQVRDDNDDGLCGGKARVCKQGGEGAAAALSRPPPLSTEEKSAAGEEVVVEMASIYQSEDNQ